MGCVACCVDSRDKNPELLCLEYDELDKVTRAIEHEQGINLRKNNGNELCLGLGLAPITKIISKALKPSQLSKAM